jgi:hypothetical protein
MGPPEIALIPVVREGLPEEFTKAVLPVIVRLIVCPSSLTAVESVVVIVPPLRKIFCVSA